MEHILEHYVTFANSNLRGFVFGFVHVAIMLVGYYSGWSINRLLKISSNGYIAGVFGAALSHIIADLVASYIDPHIRSMVFGIVLGGIIPLLLVPILEKYVVKSKNHIVVGDHDDSARSGIVLWRLGPHQKHAFSAHASAGGVLYDRGVVGRLRLLTGVWC